MARCHGMTKPPPPHAHLQGEYNDAAAHETRKDVGEVSMLHPRKEHKGDKTRITRKDKEGKEGTTQVCYHVVPRRAHERINERPARATNRDQQRCGTNQGAGGGIGNRAPTHTPPFLHREYNGTTTNNTPKGTGRET